jgi:Ca2+:H+ antiporter
MVGRHHAFAYIHMDCPLTTLTGSIPSSSSTRPQSITPQTPRRPGPAKRAPSSKKPFRGAEFSVDDEVDEVDNDLKLVRRKTRDNIHNERASLRRRESKGTLRRRPTTAQAPTLAKVDSEEGDEEAEEAQASGVDKSTASLAGKSISQDNAEPSSEDTLQGEEEEEQGEDDDDDETPGSEDDEDDDDDDADLSDAESFTLRDRQEAINETHPFGIRIWKPALYKKNRSVQRNAESDIHSAPGGRVSRWLSIFNILWVVIFGWWLAIVAAIGGVLCYFFGLLGAEGCHDYGRVLINLSSYLFYPFGKFVKLEHDEAYLEEDEGEGRSIGEYERWQTGDLEEGRLFFGPHDVNRSLIGRRREEVEDLPNETDSLLGRHDRNASGQRTDKTKKRLFGRGKWDTGRVIFFMSFYFLITPCLFFVSAICWFLVFTIPMGKVTLLLFHHLRRHPLALSFHTDSNYSRGSPGTNSHSILMCTYRAVGSKYWKYTIDGTNIFLINMLGLVAFTIFNYFVLFETLHIDNWFTSPGLNFVLGLFSIIPLAYFIGQAVASISAQSSMGVGATINAFFSTIVEVYLYCVALHQGKGQLVEGSIVGSIFAGILFLPGLSMCFGALKRKTQRFNVRSASATNTMLLFAVIGAFGPTLFYQIYGSHELNCHQCTRNGSHGPDSDCRRCYFSQTPAVHTKFYIEAVRPYTWFAAVLLFLSYIIGLLFTLRTHAAVIWNNEPDEKKDAKMEQQAHRVGERHGSLSASTTGLDHPRDHLSRNPTAGTITQGNIRDSQMYQRILSQSLKQAGLSTKAAKNLDGDDGSIKQDGQAHHIVPPKSADEDSGSIKGARIQGLSTEDNRMLVQQVAEMAATAAAVATRDATKAPHKAAHMAATRASSSYRHASGKDNESRERHGGHAHRAPNAETSSIGEVAGVVGDPAMANANAVATGSHEQASGGHDAPNWSRTKSAVILMTATVAYAVIAEILVDTVDSVLSNVDIDEKFLGITVFALVPNATEFLNAISFAMNGNIALSMEIGNSYALQVMLLQIPAVVLFTAVYSQFTDPADYADHAFTLIFPQWDMVTVILGVFLMGYVVGEGKSNYFKGSSLILTYLVFVVGFYFSGFNNLDVSDPVYLDT